ncbi:hypothetical protein EDF46_2332 [Frondihabitans sp. PhB188]|uniref:hypothetical protein n=1 Tax=Frondihabitans sp. PhB188 TaxID=2485200 RepID=UPI000F4633E7|nr:hypothetical protein [Frondihabitans sp. PhB188]ROQ38691.1 hypothetical protein EDF46_2332 [Frondihabitans sp. PhB188]
MGDAAPRGAGEGFDETSPTTRQRAKGALAVVAMIGLLLVVQPVIRDAVTEHPIINGLRIGLPFAALVVGIAATLVRSRIVARRVRRIERLRPDAVVFIAPRTPLVRTALAAVRPGIGLPARFLVSAGWQGVELWAQSTDEAPTVTFSWREVDGVAAAFQRVGAGTYAPDARTVRVRIGAGGHDSVDLPLSIYSPNLLGFARARRANEVLAGFTRWAPSRTATTP